MDSPHNNLKLEESWKKEIKDEFNKPYMQDLKRFLISEKKKGKIIYPPGDKIFNALDSTPLDKVKVVIIGQDPYHGPDQAHGLCFSVPPNIAPPPSLKNIFKEMLDDLQLPIPTTGNLSPWTKQGVLLLNSVLTVEKGKAASHQNRGWEKFTDKIIDIINKKLTNIVFILWGNYAIRKGEFIDSNKHLILKSTHPSPFSAHRGFLGSKPFSKANNYLLSVNKQPVNWQLK